MEWFSGFNVLYVLRKNENAYERDPYGLHICVRAIVLLERE